MVGRGERARRVCPDRTHPRMTTVGAIVTRIVEQYRALKATHGDEAELEIRLGSYGENGRFLPGVSKQVFEQLEMDMIDDPQLTMPCDTWSETVDYHYSGASGDPVRTRVSVDSQRMALDTVHITKTNVARAVVGRVDMGDNDVARVCLSHEIPVTDPPASCVPTHVRIKQTKAFHDVRSGGMGLVWAYELSRTWSGNTRAVVEHRQHMSEPIYEVECELIDASGAYTASVCNEDLADSVLAKSRALLGGDDRVEVTCVDEGGVLTKHETRRPRRGKRPCHQSHEEGA